MFLGQIEILFRHDQNVNPDCITLKYTLPEEEPNTWVYEASAGNIVKYYVQEITDHGLITRRLDDEAELNKTLEALATPKEVT